jgi:hypothetical protein
VQHVWRIQLDQLLYRLSQTLAAGAASVSPVRNCLWRGGVTLLLPAALPCYGVVLL